MALYYQQISNGRIWTEQEAEDYQDALLEEEGCSGEKVLVKVKEEVETCPYCQGEGFELEVDPNGMDDGGHTCDCCMGSGLVLKSKHDAIVYQSDFF